MRFNRFRFSDACLRKTPKASNNLSKYCSMISLFAMKFHQLKLRWCRCEFVDRENVSFANCKSQIMLKAFSDVQFIVIQFSCKWFASWFSIFHFSPFPNERQWTWTHCCFHYDLQLGDEGFSTKFIPAFMRWRNLAWSENNILLEIFHRFNIAQTFFKNKSCWLLSSISSSIFRFQLGTAHFLYIFDVF